MTEAIKEFAPNLTQWQHEDSQITIRSLAPRFTNMTFTKVKGSLLQIDFAFGEVTIDGQNELKEIQVNDSRVTPHTTIILPRESAMLLAQQLQQAAGAQQQ